MLMVVCECSLFYIVVAAAFLITGTALMVPVECMLRWLYYYAVAAVAVTTANTIVDETVYISFTTLLPLLIFFLP